jgi:hypothetical protein
VTSCEALAYYLSAEGEIRGAGAAADCVGVGAVEGRGSYGAGRRVGLVVFI